MYHFSFKYLKVLHKNEEYHSSLTAGENKVRVVK